jgi:hypothetical protein
MKLQLPIETANQLLGYLGTRPYQEVLLKKNKKELNY